MIVQNSGLFFPVPKSLFYFNLDACEIATYVYLKLLEDRKKYVCWPSYRTIGDAIGRSRNSVQKYVEGLERMGLITTEPTKMVTKCGEVCNGTLMYHIKPIWDVVTKYQQFLLEQDEYKNEQRRVAARLSSMPEAPTAPQEATEPGLVPRSNA